MAKSPPTVDPVEKVVEDALVDAGIEYLRENGVDRHMDFYVTFWDVWIEVKAMHTPRIADQMAREKNVIAVQGIDAARLLAAMIRGDKI